LTNALAKAYKRAASIFLCPITELDQFSTLLVPMPGGTCKVLTFAVLWISASCVMTLSLSSAILTVMVFSNSTSGKEMLANMMMLM
jgi:hypothetical protein